MILRQPRDLVREVSFPVDASINEINSDGSLQVQDGRIRWLPPAKGGTLEWRVLINNERGANTFDALLTPQWGIFRVEDVIPRARSRTLKGSVSRTTLSFELPAGWSAITEYYSRQQPIVVEREERRFDQPTGWIALGDLGIRRDTIAGTRVAIAGPDGHDVRRLDMLALLNWTLPELKTLLPDALPRLTIVSAGEPMWRGGLSAPASFFLHADRPMISENATSSLLHEVMHTALGLRPRDGNDWIVEGLAEYYSIELLRRGNAITPKRAAAAFERQATWAEQADSLCGTYSTGATTALAVTLFRGLDREMSRSSDGRVSLDDLLPKLADNEIDLDILTTTVEKLVGSTPDTLHSDKLAGCRTMGD